MIKLIMALLLATLGPVSCKENNIIPAVLRAANLLFPSIVFVGPGSTKKYNYTKEEIMKVSANFVKLN